jgi:antitoxin (DNA-binding transcriptional repressor) of toxin-antitoxin stability system
MKGFMTSLTVEQVQTNFDQAIEFVEMGKPLTITQDGQPSAILFSFKEGSELLRLRHAARLDDYYPKRLENLAQSTPDLTMEDINKLVNEFRT